MRILTSGGSIPATSEAKLAVAKTAPESVPGRPSDALRPEDAGALVIDVPPPPPSSDPTVPTGPTAPTGLPSFLPGLPSLPGARTVGGMVIAENNPQLQADAQQQFNDRLAAELGACLPAGSKAGSLVLSVKVRADGSVAQVLTIGAAGPHVNCMTKIMQSARFVATKRGGGFGLAVGFARWVIRSLTGLELDAPISGQRAMRGSTLRRVTPFARGFGMETAMTIDAARAGLTVGEVRLELEHRATGRSLAGFIHRARQLADFIGVYVSRRFRR